ncbi:AAA family ATPase [Microbacterium oryzae]|nr:ATP-binding protein [Microbacterium oryzae]
MGDEELLGGLQRLLQRLNELPDTREPRPTVLGQHVADFLGREAHDLPVTRDTVGRHRLADVSTALDSLAAEDPDAELIGVSGGQERNHEDFSAFLRHRYAAFSPGPVDYSAAATGPDTSRQVVSFGIHLLHVDSEPVAVLLRGAAPMYGREAVTIEALAATPETGAALLAEVRRRMNALSHIRGQVVSFTPDEFGQGAGGFTFLRRPEVAASDVILPEGLLARVAGHVVDIGVHSASLRASGQHLKRGVLLYGPPGTGKTLTVQHLLTATPERTAILLQGGSLQFVAEAARLARAMAPALLVFEDIDLIAMERGMFGGPQPLLFEILDALDGVGEDADIAFLMTTNRADLLEPALAARPGRVDLAVEIPLPDVAARRRLFRLYGERSSLSGAALDAAAERAEGVTASFAKELIRRTVLRAVLGGRDARDEDLAEALDEMLDTRDQLTRTLLGSNPALLEADDAVSTSGSFGWSPLGGGPTPDEGEPADGV